MSRRGIAPIGFFLLFVAAGCDLPPYDPEEVRATLETFLADFARQAVAAWFF